MSTDKAPCSCWSETDKKLLGKGYRISDACSAFSLKGNTLTVRHYLPLQRSDGKKLRTGDAKGVAISFCPFCGQALPTT